MISENWNLFPGDAFLNLTTIFGGILLYNVARTTEKEKKIILSLYDGDTKKPYVQDKVCEIFYYKLNHLPSCFFFFFFV